MSFYRALGALVLAGAVLAGCSKTADKGKTEDQLVAQGFTKDQAKCITDQVWDKIPKDQRDKLTDKNATLTDDQKKVFGTAAVSCARDTVVAQMKSEVASAGSATPEQVDCVTGKLTDDDLVALMTGNTDALSAAITSCVTTG